VADLKVENVIAASHLGKELELVRLATEMPNARYSGSGNPSVIVEVDAGSNKRAAGILFGNGKIQVTGINSLNEGRQVMESLKNMVKGIDSKVNMKRATKLENIVAKTNLGRTLDLQAIALAIPGSEYEPTRFKGLVIRLNDPQASFILFQSGVLIVTDITSEAKAKKALNRLEKFMTEIS
jgi:transcription initiation factor TFIID TATA-box-binding protein